LLHQRTDIEQELLIEIVVIKRIQQFNRVAIGVCCKIGTNPKVETQSEPDKKCSNLVAAKQELILSVDPPINLRHTASCLRTVCIPDHTSAPEPVYEEPQQLVLVRLYAAVNFDAPDITQPL